MTSHRILLTGANGFIALHILSLLLSLPAKHSVRAVVRSQSKADDVKALFSSASSAQLDFAIVPDITAHGAFDEALESEPVSTHCTVFLFFGQQRALIHVSRLIS